jgi:hypothetical protein
MVLDGCPGCETPTAVDHSHQFMNWWGNATTTWQIDGVGFTKLDDAIAHVSQLYGCDQREADAYVRRIKKLIN